MPLYEYECRGCGVKFEFLVHGDDRPACPSCGGEDLTKLLSAPSAHTSSSSGPACPARDAGACGSPCCGDGGCGMNWG
ncbi:MAG: zinc ribbon domain-containing protein [Pirellulales bacterium]|nr:zinc ribbon domain-containing protein [Pirellulales bacterium]